jgi:hypothetical protein
MTDKYELQNTCEHPKPVFVAKETETRRRVDTWVEYDVFHFHCKRCGMFFAREDWTTIRPKREVA